MPGMTVPTCCSPLDDRWPLPQPMPGTVLLSTRFDPTQLQADDFSRSAIDMPASIQRSVAKRQSEYLAGRVCARAALQRLTGQPHVPALGEDRAPVWPLGICGSITHGRGWAAAIVAPVSAYQGLGLDVENLLAPERAQRLAGEILTTDELTRLAALPDELRAMAVTLTFSAKESLFKALYPLVGKRFYFEHAEVLSWELDGTLRLRLLTDLAEEWPIGSELDGQFAMQGEFLLSLVSVAS